MSVKVGDVYNEALVEKLDSCSHLRRNVVVESSFMEGFRRVKYFCSFDGRCCGSCGHRLRFIRSCFGCRVIWVCPKLIGVPDLDR